MIRPSTTEGRPICYPAIPGRVAKTYKRHAEWVIAGGWNISETRGNVGNRVWIAYNMYVKFDYSGEERNKALNDAKRLGY